MKNQIIAFLTDSENFDLQSVTDAMHHFGLCDLEDEEFFAALGLCLEAYFCTRSEVEASEWIAEEDMNSFEEFCEDLEAFQEF